jgi:NIMA (never in mitosis gene a)-related kinase
MRNLSHQYIIRYYESFQDENNNVCIIMEYAENGELEQYLNSRKASNSLLTEDEVLEWFIQLCVGLKCIHDSKILHRDLKCENIFINSQNELKIGDFGISKLMNQTFDMAKTKIGTPYIMAP